MRTSEPRTTSGSDESKCCGANFLKIAAFSLNDWTFRYLHRPAVQVQIAKTERDVNLEHAAIPRKKVNHVRQCEIGVDPSGQAAVGLASKGRLQRRAGRPSR